MNTILYTAMVQTHTLFIPGNGRFGLVVKAQAQGIAPEQPHLNVVAVKTTKRGEGNLVFGLTVEPPCQVTSSQF